MTGTVTGEPPRVEEIQEVKSGASDVPVLIGSGVDPSNARTLLDASDGAIVGTSLKTGDHIDSAKVRTGSLQAARDPL